MNRFAFALIALGGFAAFTCGAGIVHSPYAAFVANYNGATFSNGPQVDENGGIWSYGYRYSIASTELTAFSETKFTRSASALGGLAKIVGASFMPYVTINPTQSNVKDVGSTPKRAATPGDEFIVQPGTPSTGGANCGVPVIRFTAPRTGCYSLTAVCEPLSGNISSEDGVTSFHVLVNGRIVAERDVRHWQSGNSDWPGEIYTFDIKGIVLAKGEYVELVTSTGLKSATGKDLSYSNDSASVKIEVSEDEHFYSLGHDMVASNATGAPANPLCDGRWTICQGAYFAGDPFPDGLTSLRWGFSRDTHFFGLSADGTTGRSQTYVCANTSPVSQTCLTSTLEPAEIVLTPTSTNTVILRFTTPVDGTWRVTTTARNLQESDDTSAATAGVCVRGFAGGRILFARAVGNPRSASGAGARASATLTGLTSRLKAGAFIDLTVDPRGSNAYDPTGLKLFVEKVDDGERTFSNAGVSFAAEAAKLAAAQNPFVDADGVTWEVGESATAFGAFMRLPYFADHVTGYLAGWRPSATDNLPRLLANYNRRLLTAAESANDKGQVMYDDEFFLHPKNGRYCVLRYYAPSTGVYRVNAAFRDVSWLDWAQTDPGVWCHVRANGSIVASDRAVRQEKNPWSREVAVLTPQKLYLKAGEPIDLSAGIDRQESCDSTFVSGTIEGEGLAEGNFVNVDFRVAAGEAFAGRGRIGWAEPRWNAVTVGSGSSVTKAHLRTADGTRTTVSVTVARASGAAIATMTDATDNAFLASGILSEGKDDGYAFVISGLEPNAAYRLCLYGGGKVGDDAANRAAFAVGTVSARADYSWFRRNRGEQAIIDWTADANGEICGTFAAAQNAPVGFFGLQIAGDAFTTVPPPGLMVIVK